MNTSVKRIALPVAIVAAVAIVLSMVLVTVNMLFYNGNNDTVINAARIMYHSASVAGLVLVAIGIAIIARYVVIIGYMAYIWLLVVVFGEKRILRKRTPNVRHAQ